MSAIDDFRNTGGGPTATPNQPGGRPPRHPRGFRAFAARRPLTAFLVVALPLGWAVLAVPALAHHGVLPGGGLPGELFALGATVLVLLPTAAWVVSVSEGRGAVRGLFSRTFRWRFGPTWWVAVLIALPVATVAAGVVLGRSLESGDLPSTLAREFPLMLLPIVLVNMWEETVWAGFVQSRLERRHGLLWAAVLTALGFAAIHLPLLFWDDVSPGSLLTGLAVLLVAALLVRLTIGVFLRATAGSVLAVAVLHASWNGSSGEDGLVDALLSGGQPVVPALVGVALVMAAAIAVVRPKLTGGSRDSEQGAMPAAPSSHR